MAKLQKDGIESICVCADNIKDNFTLNAILSKFDLDKTQLVSNPKDIDNSLEKKIYLYIDNAELLENKIIQDLINISFKNKGNTIKIFLFGKSSLEYCLKKIFNLDNSFVFHNLNHYSIEEQNIYLTKKLNNVGYKLNIFSDDDLSKIYYKSEGCPGLINQVAKTILIEKKLNKRISLDRFSTFKQVMRRHKWKSIVVLSVLVAFIFSLNSLNEANMPNEEESLQLKLIKKQ